VCFPEAPPAAHCRATRVPRDGRPPGVIASFDRIWRDRVIIEPLLTAPDGNA
jgi:hypothetical protein